MENLESRVNRLEEGLDSMKTKASSTEVLAGHLKDTMRELTTVVKELGQTNVQIQVAIQSMQREIEKGNLSNEKMGKKIDEIAKVWNEIQVIRGYQNTMEERNNASIKRVHEKIDDVKDDLDELKKEYKTYVQQFEDHKDEGKLNLMSLIRNGAGWLLSIILAIVIIWTILGQNVKLP